MEALSSDTEKELPRRELQRAGGLQSNGWMAVVGAEVDGFDELITKSLAY